VPDRQPESQEEILAACEASLTVDDIPPEDEAFGWPDPDCGMPADLLALSDAELDELLEATPARPAPLAWPIPLRTLLDLADAPGEAAGYGPLHADTCRTLTDAMASHPATEWGVIITDDTGRAMAYGGPATARRTTPAGKPAVPDGAQGSPTAGKARGSPTTGRADGPPTPGGPQTAGRTLSPPTGRAGGWTITLTTEPIAPYQ
jgi:hypothetical protein